MNNIMTEQQTQQQPDGLNDTSQDSALVWDEWLKQQPINFTTACKGLGLTPSELLDACRFANTGTDSDGQPRSVLAVKLPRNVRAIQLVTDGLGMVQRVTETTLFRGSVYRLDNLSVSGINANGDGVVYELEGVQNSLGLCQCDDDSEHEHDSETHDTDTVMGCFERFELVDPANVVASLLYVEAQFYEALKKQKSEAGTRTPDERIAHLTAELEKANDDKTAMLAELKKHNASPRSDSTATYTSLITTLWVMADKPLIKQVHSTVEDLSKDEAYQSRVCVLGQAVIGKYLQGLSKLAKQSASQ